MDLKIKNGSLFGDARDVSMTLLDGEGRAVEFLLDPPGGVPRAFISRTIYRCGERRGWDLILLARRAIRGDEAAWREITDPPG